MKKLMLAVMVVTGMSGAWAAGEPSIDLTRVQQRYPWNGLVDIDYTVANVPNPEDYYLKFTFFPTEASAGIVATNFLDCSMLMMASNGTYRATWDTREQGAEIVSKNVTVSADLICDPGCKGERTHYANFTYLVIDLSGGPTATSYPVTTERFLTQDEANAKYNTGEYKTDKLVLRRVRAGTFMMGSPESETERNERGNLGNCETQHRVVLTKDFYLGVFEMTQAQYYRVMGSNPSGRGNNEDSANPVESLWYYELRGGSNGCTPPLDYGKVDEGSFMYILSARTGMQFDLPTEAQWEYACRAGTTTRTYAGNSAADLNGAVWYGENINSLTHVVGLLAPNPWGFYDMIGNVWEMTRDWVVRAPNDNFGYATTETQIPEQIDPIRQVSESGYVVLRGGSLYDSANMQRAAFRLGITNPKDTTRDFSIGFRICRTLP